MAIADDDLSTPAPASHDIAQELADLKARISEQHRRIAELEAGRLSQAIRIHEPTDQPSRRALLRRAGQVGVATAGALGGMALLSQSAAAANGGPVVLGTTNTETTTTTIQGGGSAPTPIFKATTTGSSATYATALQAVASFETDTAIEAVGDASTGTFSATAIYAHTTGGLGVQATATTGFALSGQASAAGGIGVVAWAGGRAPLSVTAASAAGPPSTGAHYHGDFWTDNVGQVWVCVTAGTPGIFAPLQTGGANVSHFVRVSKLQYLQAGSDGANWKDMDAVKLALTLTPAFNAQAVISISADLWTANAGLNQDIGVYIEGGAYGAAGSGKIVAWKESGGYAGAFSPNAAFVETSQPVVAGTAYTIKVRWKTNKPAGGGTIAAGAGPLPVGSTGGGVAGEFSPTRLAVTLIQDGPNPATLSGPMAAPRNDPNLLPSGPKARPRGAKAGP